MAEEKENNEILNKLEKQKSKKKIITIALASILLVILIFIALSFYLYFKSPEKQLGLGANIEEVKLSQEKDVVYIKLAGESDKNITKIKFIFTDAKGNEYSFETSEGAQEISVPFKKGFFDWLFGKPAFSGKYDYEIKADEINLNNFENINEVSVLFEYKTETGETIETPVLDTTKTTTKTTTGGGTSNNGGGPSGDNGCTAKTCSDYPGQCGNSLDNRCSGSLDCSGNCGTGETCNLTNNTCVAVQCISDNNCTIFNNWKNVSRVVSYTECRDVNQTRQEYSNYSCSILNTCQLNSTTNTTWQNTSFINKTDGTLCSFGSCQGGVCVSGCTPKSSCNAGECGTWNNGTCSGTLNCGGCGSGYTCSSPSNGSCVLTCTNDSQCEEVFGEDYICENEKCVEAPAETFPQDYVSFWKFDSSSAGKTSDETGRNNGTLVGNANIFSDTERGNVSSFDGNGDYIRVINSPSLNFTTNDFTISAWVKYAVGGTIVSHRGVNYEGYEFSSGQDMGIYIGFNGTYTGKSSLLTNKLNDTKWHHIAVVVNRSSNAEYYVDGSFKGFGNISSIKGDIGNSADFKIGAWSNNYFNGLIDDILIYNRSLSLKEVQQLFAKSQLSCAEQGGYNCQGRYCIPGSDILANDTNMCCRMDCINQFCGDNHCVGDENSANCPADCSREFYVSADGNDSNIGTETFPWKTIQYGVDQLIPGDTLYVRGGIYKETFRDSHSGNEGNRITIRNYPGETPVIDGSDLLTGWTKCTSANDCSGNSNWQNIYYAYAPVESEIFTANLYQNDEMLSISQHPNPSDPFYMDDKKDYLTPENITNSSIIDSRLEGFGGVNLIGSYVAVYTTNPSGVVFKKITGYIPAENKLLFEIIIQGNPVSYSLLNNLNNVTLDKPGEFYFNETNEIDNTHKVYLWPFNNQNLSKEGEVTVSVRTELIYLGAVNYTTIEGFKIQKGVNTVLTTYIGGSRTGLIIRNNELTKCRATVETANMIYMYVANNLIVENNYLHSNAGRSRGIVCGGNNLTVKNNVIDKQGGTTIYFSGSNYGQIINNTILGSKGSHSNGITTYQGSSNILVAGNKVFDSNNAYTVQASSNITVYNNLFDNKFNAGYVMADWGGNSGYIYVLNNLLRGSDNDAALHSLSFNNPLVKNNIIQGGGVGNHSYNIITSTGYNVPIIDSSEIFERNLATIFLSAPEYEYSYIIPYPDQPNTIYVLDQDSYLYNRINIGDYIERVNDGISGGKIISKQSLVDANISNWMIFTKIVHSSLINESGWVGIWKDTDFTRDYHLKQGSPAIDNGTDISEIIPELQIKYPDYNFYQDIEGNTRPQGVGWDIGAYEYVEKIGGTVPSFSPFARILNFLKGLLTRETGKAILTGKTITGNAVNETNENGNSKTPYIILSLLAVIILIIVIMIVKIKSSKKKSKKKKEK